MNPPASREGLPVMTEHTKLPWRLELARWTPDAPVCGFGIFSDYKHPNLPDGWKMHSIVNANLSERPAYEGCYSAAEIEANAKYIVQAVNSYPEMRRALEEIISANDEFRKGMPDNWGGDPLQDACDRARKALATDREVKDAISIDHRAN